MGWELALLAFGCLIVGIFYVSLLVYLVCIKQWTGRKTDRERFERKVLNHRNSSTYYSSCPTKRSYVADNSDFVLLPSSRHTNASPTTVRSWRHQDSRCHSFIPEETHSTLRRHCENEEVESRCSKARSYVVAMPRPASSNYSTLRSKILTPTDVITSDDELTSASGFKRAISCKGSLPRIYVTRSTLQRSASCHSAYPEVEIVRATSCRSCNSCASSHIGKKALTLSRSNSVVYATVNHHKKQMSQRKLDSESCSSDSDGGFSRRTRSLDRRSISSRKSYKPTLLCDICDL